MFRNKTRAVEDINISIALDDFGVIPLICHLNLMTLGNRSAYQLFSFLHGEGILENLDIKQIPPNEINLTPLLLKK